MVEPKHIATALDVRRGKLRLREVPEADRRDVALALARTSDANFARIAESQENRRRKFGGMTTSPTRAARSV